MGCLPMNIFTILLKLLLYPSPKIEIFNEEKSQFDEIFERAMVKEDRFIEYNLQIPKMKFIKYISHHKHLMLHGSNTNSIKVFEPKKQTLYNGTWTEAVFATRDPIWPVFYAVFQRQSLIKNFRNGCLTADGKKYYHFYSLNKQTVSNEPCTSGVLYFLPDKTFKQSGGGRIQFDEWVSSEAVEPVLKLAVEPEDFYFLHKVSIHGENESNLKTWLLYKLRNVFKRRTNNN